MLTFLAFAMVATFMFLIMTKRLSALIALILVPITFALLGVYRIGCHIPSPGVDPNALLDFMQSQANGFLGFVNTFTGGSLQKIAVFALGIMPYITASIILQLLTVVWPYLEKLSKEGEMGRRKITQWTRYGTVLISIIQGTGIAIWLAVLHQATGALLLASTVWGAHELGRRRA